MIAPSVGELRAGHYWLWVNCSNIACGRRVALPLTPLIVRWGPAATSDLLRAALRCTRCGTKGVTLTAASWGGRSVGWVLMHDTLREQWTGTQDWHPELGAFSVETMCNLYSQSRSREEIIRLFKVSHNRAEAMAPQPAIFPGNAAPVVRQAADGERELAMLSWGFVLVMKGQAPKRVTNVRDDKLASPFWAASFRERRCLVPVTSFSEPKGKKPAIWHWFALSEAREPFAFAGVWRAYRGPVRKDGETVEIDTFAFLTTKPNELVATVHPARMPVMLVGEDAQARWLDGKSGEAETLIRSYPAERMRIVRAGLERADQ